MSKLDFAMEIIGFFAQMKIEGFRISPELREEICRTHWQYRRHQ